MFAFPKASRSAVCCLHVKLYSSVKHVLESRRLTGRSTGRYTACRHLGYKSLAQIPPTCSAPVSSNVSHHSFSSAQLVASSKCKNSERLCSPRAEKCRNGRASSVLPSSMKAPTSAKSDVGWRFAPACCAAQSDRQTPRRSAAKR